VDVLPGLLPPLFFFRRFWITLAATAPATTATGMMSFFFMVRPPMG